MVDRTLTYRLQAEIGQFRAQFAQASLSAKKLGDDLTAATKQGAAWRSGLTHIGNAAGKMGLAAAAGLGMAAKAAIDWETAWAGVTKTVDGSASQMAELENGLRELARTMPATHDEIAAVAEAAGQLGVARENVVDFTKTMVMLGETTNLTADEAATTIAQMANVMRTAPEDIDNLGAALVALGNDGASTEAQIIQMAQRISGAGAQIGLAESEILAIANAAASMGLEVEAGGTAVSRVFTSLARATAEGGPKLQAFADTAGMATDEFARLFESSPAQAFAAFTAGLDRVNKSGGNVFATLKALGLSDVRVSDALLRMAASGDLLTDSLDLGAQAWEENSALMNEFAKRADTTASEMQVAWNNVKDAGIELGATMLPLLGDLAESVSSVAQGFGSLPGPVKTATAGLMGLTAVVGGGAWFGSKVIQGVADTRVALSQLGITAEATKGKLLTLNNAARAGAGLAALGLAATDLDEDLGVANTALYALYGTMILPGWGTAAGALVGAMSDLSAASKESAAHIASWNAQMGAAVESGDLAEQASLVAKVREEVAAYDEQLSSGWTDRVRGWLSFMGPEKGSEFTNLGQQSQTLADLEKQLDDNRGAALGAGDAQGTLASATRSATIAAETSVEALQKQRDAATETAQQFFNLGDSLNDSKVSLKEWINQMADQAEALRDFRVNAKRAAKEGLDQGLIASLREAGPEGALRMRQLANATDAEITRANRAWRKGQAEVQKYTDDVADADNLDVNTKVDVDAGQAFSTIRAVEASLRALDGKTAHSYVITHRKYDDPRLATGGFIAGPGSGTSDSIPAWLSNGEFVVNAAATARHRSLLEAINSQRYAGGGMVSASGPVTGGGDGIGALTKQVALLREDVQRSAVVSGREFGRELNGVMAAAEKGAWP